MLFGLAMLMVPIAPAALYIFQRSAADPKCACSGPGSDFGVAARCRPRSRPSRIEAGEVVDVPLGNVQAVADEDERRLDRRRGIDPHADVGVLAERQRLGLCHLVTSARLDCASTMRRVLNATGWM